MLCWKLGTQQRYRQKSWIIEDSINELIEVCLMGRKVVPTISTYLKLWNLSLLFYMAKEWILIYMAKYVIKLRLLRGVCPSLSRRAVNVITCILVREKSGEVQHFTQWRRWQEDGAERDVATNQGMPTTTRRWTGKEYILPRACRESVAL